MPEYKLIYFNGMGIAEPIRILLHYLERPFEDVRMTFDDWTPEKKQETPWGKVPILEIDGKSICQSLAICRYLGKEAHLAGQDNLESLQIDMHADTAMDLRGEFSGIVRETDEEAKKARKEKFFSEPLPFYLTKFDEIIGKNDGYLVNGKLSWADIVLCNLCQVFSLFGEHDVTENYPNLHALQQKYIEHPKLAEYISNRTKTDF